MLSIGFWNLGRNSTLHPYVVELIKSYGIDILLLAECTLDLGVLLKQLNSGVTAEFHRIPRGQCEKIEIVARFSEKFFTIVKETHRLTIQRLTLPARTDIIIAANHFISKSNWKDTSQFSECIELSRDMKEAEALCGHRRSVLVGDLNMNPFEDGMVVANGLNAVMNRSIAKKSQQTIQGRSYPFFYNPMWRFLGDIPGNPSGTYYYPRTEHAGLFWNVFDQVLVRPELLDRFSDDHLTIPVSTGTRSLLTSSGLLDKAVVSDHLPLVFQLSI